MNAFDYFFENSKNLEKDFVLGDSENISYKKLHNDSLRIACFLRNKIGSNNNITLISTNSVFFITAYLGIIKSGNICVPIDPNIEIANLNYILDESDCKIVFASKKSNDRIQIDDSILVYDELRMSKIIDSQNIILDFFKKINDDNDIAEILFTSGSTGKPKGVMLSHLNIITNSNSIIQYLDLNEYDRICVVLPFYYCYGLSLLHTHLRIGGSIVLNNTFMFLSTVISDIKEFKCTGFAGVPSHFQMLLKKSTSFKNTELPDLRYVTQAGGKLHEVFINEFVTAFPNINLFVMYGQTEATARLSYLKPELVRTKLGSIGKAIPNVILKIVDRNGDVVLIGNEGELIAQGNNIMVGYYKDRMLTKSTLKNGWLFTGDLAKTDEDGFIFIVGRKKEFIKVGGKRVSPKEIEHVIVSVPDVIDCSVEAVYDNILAESIKATIVIDSIDKENQIRGEVLKQCRNKLSLFKIPQTFVFTEKLEYKSSGKK